MLLSRPVSRDFLSWTTLWPRSVANTLLSPWFQSQGNIFMCLHLVNLWQPVQNTLSLWLWLNSLRHSTVMTYVQSLCRRQSFFVSLESFNLWDYWTLCVHVFWWQIGLLLLTGTEIHRKTISRVTSRTTFGRTVPEKSTIHRNRGILLTMNTINEPSDDELELKVQLLLT